MKEIKFRQENRQTGKWHYWGFIDGGFITPLESTGGGASYQFTGLHDGNGKEIYERDIVKKGDNVGEVRYSTDIGQMYYGPYFLRAIDQKEMEVIGNAHQNPELLR